MRWQVEHACRAMLDGTMHRMLHCSCGHTSVCASDALRDRTMPVCQAALPGVLHHTQLFGVAAYRQ